MEQELIKVELGCGKTKSDGFIGIDRFPLSGVDVVADMNKKLPLEDGFADIIYASHSLEHLEDMEHIMSEIYRICKHKAVVYILAPYSSTSLNIANFYHKIQFNEDTFRLFSNEKESLIDSEEYYCPHSTEWGLEQSDNSNGTIEFKLLKMEYFYYKEYSHLSESEKLHARKSLFNVCDQIFYALVVNKSGSQLSGQEIIELQEVIQVHEPPVISALRYRDAHHLESKSIITDITDISKLYVKKIQTETDNLKIEADNLKNETDNLKNETDNLKNETDNLKKESIYIKNEAHKSAKRVEDLLDSNKHDINRLYDEFNEQNKTMDNLLVKLNRLEINFERVENLRNIDSDSTKVILLDLLKSHDKNKFYNSLYSYYRGKDLFNTIKELYVDFIDGIILGNNSFNKNSLLSASKIVPYSGYLEYSLAGSGNLIHYFLFANYGAELFIELVQNGNIVKQMNITIEHEGEQCIECEGINGEILIRFRTLDNKSVVRILELTNRRKMLLVKKVIAAYID